MRYVILKHQVFCDILKVSCSYKFMTEETVEVLLL